MIAPLLLALAASCDGGVREEPSPARLLELRAAAPAPSIVGTTRATTLRVPPDIAPWTVYAGRSEVGPPEDVPGAEYLPDGLYLYGNKPKNVLIPGPFEPGAFNRVAVAIFVKVHSVVEVQLMRGGEAVLSSGVMRVWSSDVLQRVVADLPWTELEREPFDTLRIRVGVNAGPVCIESVELISEPLRAWLGPAGGAPEPRSIGGDERLATLLTSEVPLATRFEARRASLFSFSCGLPERLRFPGQRARLRVTLRGSGGGEASHDIPLEPPPGEPTRWRAESLDLSRFAGEVVDARLELHVEGSRPGFAFVAEPRAVELRPDAPAVLLVTSDTHRGDHLGAARDPAAVQTPTLDALAERGVLFEACWSTTNITVPSHVSMLTGVHPRDTRVVDNVTTLVREATTLAEAFLSAGYRTFAAVSAYHLDDALSGLGQGFERMSAPDANERRADATCAVARGWLDDCAGEPVFLWLHLFDAHGPYDPPGDFALAYEAEPVPTAPVALKPEVAEARARYRGEVSWLDHQLGLLLAHPRLDGAVVAVTADHGECLGQHDIYYAHEGLYTDTIHVPLVLAWPGAAGGARVERPVQNLHVGRTLLDLAGLESIDFPGHNLLEDSRGGEPLFTISSAGDEAAITHDGWHLILHLHAHGRRNEEGAPQHELHALELYDLATDPGCERDLAGAEPERARELRAALVRWLLDAPGEGLASDASVDAELRAHLAGLGYAAEATAIGSEWIDAECACAGCEPYR